MPDRQFTHTFMPHTLASAVVIVSQAARFAVVHLFAANDIVIRSYISASEATLRPVLLQPGLS